MKATQQAAQRITVSLPPQDHEALSMLAERCDVSLSWLTRQAIAEFLKKHGEGDKSLPLDLDAKRLVDHD